MNYKEKREEYIKLRDQILREYETLLEDASRFSKLGYELTAWAATMDEKVDLLELFYSNEATKKADKLRLSLLCDEPLENGIVVPALKKRI